MRVCFVLLWFLWYLFWRFKDTKPKQSTHMHGVSKTMYLNEADGATCTLISNHVQHRTMLSHAMHRREATVPLTNVAMPCCAGVLGGILIRAGLRTYRQTQTNSTNTVGG